MLIEVVALLLSQKLLATAHPDSSLDSRTIFNRSKASPVVRYVRNAEPDDLIDYEDYVEQRDEENHNKPGRKKKKFEEGKATATRKTKATATRKGRGGEVENSPQTSLKFCFKVCNSLIFEVYQLLGGNVCNCDK